MKKLKLGHLAFLFLIIFFVFIYIRNSRIHDDIRRNGENIVVKFVKKKRYPKTTDFYFSYYIGDSLITTTGSGIQYSILNSEKETQAINDLKIGAYYLARFNAKYPKIIQVDPEKQINDTLEIQRFGFDLQNKSAK